MIVRVSIENLVIVERAEFEPGTGLTAVTGETGAGKTLLASAIRLLCGADADARYVGPYGDGTYVEGEFAVGARHCRSSRTGARWDCSSRERPCASVPAAVSRGSP